tara:strand:+ start:846 stop:1076 length:231 start_codon:yes stop_codon:yes gene_type:complete
MQKIINAVAASTFLLALANTAVIVLAVTRGPSMVKKHINDIKLELTETLTQMLPGEIEGALPEFPTSTGPAIPFGQ